MLHEQEVWLANHQGEIETRIAEGYAAAQRGDLIDPDAVRSRLEKLKQARSHETPRE